MRFSHLASFCAALCVSGCGTYVPELQEFYQSKVDARLRVATLVEHLECEVVRGVQSVLLADEDLASERRKYGLSQPTVLDWLKKWAAQITLTLTVEEKSALNPSLTLNRYFPTIPVFPDYKMPNPVNASRVFNLGLAAAFSTDATRKETLSLYLDLSKFTDTSHLKLARQLRGESQDLPNCNTMNGILIDSDLKFRDWLYDVTVPAAVEKGPYSGYAGELTQEETVAKKDVLSHEVTFVIIYGGNATPAWKLVNISSNQGSTPFLSAQRTNTQDAIITLGPKQGETLSTAAQNTILASQIGISVANALKNSQQ
jgi:hypothetical protein